MAFEDSKSEADDMRDSAMRRSEPNSALIKTRTSIQSLLGSNESVISMKPARDRIYSEEISETSSQSDKKPMSKQHTMSLMNYIKDTIDSLIEYLCKRVLLMPAPIRYFAKAVFEFHKAVFATEKGSKKSSSLRAVQKVAEFIFDKWLVAIIS